MKNQRLAAIILGGLLVISALVLWIVLDFPLSNAKPFSLTTTDGEPIQGTYYPGNKPAGILILSGFGADQVMLKPVTVEYVKAGVHTWTIDFPGQGLSGGALTFDNAQTDRLTRIIHDSLGQFVAASGLRTDQIILFGHSLGARVALQTTLNSPRSPAGLILFGAQVNLGTNNQSEFFTGTQDSELTWVKALSSQQPVIPVFLLTGTWDDIITVDGASSLMKSLCGKTVQPGEICGNPQRQWVLQDHLLHNFEIYSSAAIDQSKQWAASLWNTKIPALAAPSTADLRAAGWIAFLAGLFILLAGILKILKPSPTSARLKITSTRRFLWGKLGLWLAALPLALVLMVIYMLIPLPIPVFNLIYGGFIGAYGLLMAILYRAGKAPGVHGKLIATSRSAPASRTQILLAVIFNLSLAASLTVFFQSGHGQVPPGSDRLLWLIIFTPLTALGFWVGLHENEAMLTESGQRRPIWLLNLVNLAPFFLRVVLMLALLSTSGVIGAVYGLIVLAIILLQGEITLRLTHSALVAVIVQSVLLYWLVLPSGPLFLRPF